MTPFAAQRKMPDSSVGSNNAAFNPRSSRPSKLTEKDQLWPAPNAVVGAFDFRPMIGRQPESGAKREELLWRKRAVIASPPVSVLIRDSSRRGALRDLALPQNVYLPRRRYRSWVLFRDHDRRSTLRIRCCMHRCRVRTTGFPECTSHSAPSVQDEEDLFPRQPGQ